VKKQSVRGKGEQKIFAIKENKTKRPISRTGVKLVKVPMTRLGLS
jgi:hypothetical protein